MLVYARNAETLQENLKAVVMVCKEKGLKLNTLKCDFFSKGVQFGGRIIDKNVSKFNPRHYETLKNMERPTTCGSLMELVHGAS